MIAPGAMRFSRHRLLLRCKQKPERFGAPNRRRRRAPNPTRSSHRSHCDEVHKGAAEIVGVQRELAERLSKRREEIIRELERGYALEFEWGIDLIFDGLERPRGTG